MSRPQLTLSTRVPGRGSRLLPGQTPVHWEQPSHAGSLRCGCSTHAGAVERVKLGCSDGRAAAPVHCLWVSRMGLSGCPFRDMWVRTWLAYKDCSGLVEQWGA